MHAHELGEILRREGRSSARDPAQSVIRALGRRVDVVCLADDRFLPIGALLDGRVFTHEIGIEPWITGVLDPGKDVFWLHDRVKQGLVLGDGAELQATWGSVAFPDQWLEQFPRRATLAFHVLQGVLHVDACELDDDSAERGLRLQQTLRRRLGKCWNDWDGPDRALSELGRLMYDDPELLTAPTTPLSQLLPAGRRSGTYSDNELTIFLPIVAKKFLERIAAGACQPVDRWAYEQLISGARREHRPWSEGSSDLVPLHGSTLWPDDETMGW